MDWAAPYRCECGNTRRFQEVLWEQEEETTPVSTMWAWIVGLWCDRCGAVLYEAPEVSILRLLEDSRPPIQMDQIYYDRFHRLPKSPFAFLPGEPLGVGLPNRPCRITLREVDQHHSLFHWMFRRIGSWFASRSREEAAQVESETHELTPPR